MSRTHELKTWPEFFEAVVKREKTFELRYNDRDFKVKDRLRLMEFDPCRACRGKGKMCDYATLDGKFRSPIYDCPDCKGAGGLYTGRSEWYVVTYVLTQHQGLREGYVIMGLY